MRIKRIKSIKPIYILVFVLVLALMGVFAYKYAHKDRLAVQTIGTTSTGQKIDLSPATPADKALNDARKGSSSTPSTTLENYQAPSNTANFGVTVTRAGLSSDRSNLQVAALLNGASSGTCTFNIHRSGQSTVTDSETVSLQVNSYVCPAMNFPLSKFPVRGDWSVSVTVISNGKTATSDWANNPVSLD